MIRLLRCAFCLRLFRASRNGQKYCDHICQENAKIYPEVRKRAAEVLKAKGAVGTPSMELRRGPN